MRLRDRALLDPLSFRNGVRSRNRIWLAPMTNQESHADGSLSDDELRWLEMRARGGFVVVETCAAHIALDGQGWRARWESTATSCCPASGASPRSSVALVAAGGVWTRGEAEAVLARGADAVAIGRAAIANPDWA